MNTTISSDALRARRDVHTLDTCVNCNPCKVYIWVMLVIQLCFNKKRRRALEKYYYAVDELKISGIPPPSGTSSHTEQELTTINNEAYFAGVPCVRYKPYTV